MIYFILYTLFFAGLIWLGRKQLIKKAGTLHPKFLLLLFLLKIAAVPVFYWIYEQRYGGIENLDTGKFYHDVKVIAAGDRSFFWRLIIGQQNDQEGSADYEQFLKATKNWDNGTVKDFFYNDNRVVIRIHALLDVFTFDSYLVHALFSCLFSCIGIWWLFVAFRHVFKKQELNFLLLLCLFPSLWFYSGALLKEGLCLLVMGAAAKGLSTVTEKQWQGICWLLPALLLSLFLKPYLLLSFFLFTAIYFILRGRFRFRYQSILFLTLLLCAGQAANSVSLHFKNRSLGEAALQHQRRFEAVSHGGVFLSDGYHYLQLPADTHLIVRQAGPEKKYFIRPGTSYMYWKPNRSFDTLYATADMANKATYDLVYYLPPAGSTIQLNKSNPFALVFSALYHALFYPLFFPFNGFFLLLASFENLILLFSLLVIIFQFRKKRKGRFFGLIFVSFALAISLLTGITAPNSGAIFRYRAPAAVFIPLSALLFFPRNRRGRSSSSAEAIKK